jgi:dinuclear metal center YbgI/SA1388 family protein
MLTIQNVVHFLQGFASPDLAEDWDNVGLLVGDRNRPVQRVMTCLTVTLSSAAEAIRRGASLIVSHHPIPFHAIRRLTTETTTGCLLLDLIESRVAVYSPHTAFDSAPRGVNQRLAAGLRLRGISPLTAGERGRGVGRAGWLEEPIELGQLAERLKQFLRIDRLQIVGAPEQAVRVVAVACGAAGELLDAARDAGCDAMVVGETRFHTCLEAEATNIGLLLPGHFASERFAVECLRDILAAQFPELEVWASEQETDPVRWV